MPTTKLVWITRKRTTPNHIRGLLTALEEAEALDLAEITILAVDDEDGVSMAKEAISSLNGQPASLDRDLEFTIDTLPPMGILWAADEPM